MFPAAFDYRAPTSVDEVLDILAGQGDEAKVMAGGQSLIPLLKLRFATPALVVDIGRVPGLAGIQTDAGGGLRIGARTRHVDVERSASLRSACPILLDAAPQIADPVVRNAGTLGGSVAHADPQGDWGSVMIALDAQMVVRSRRGQRSIPARQFFDGPFTTTMQADELLTEIVVPAPQGRAAGTYLKLERKVGDFATVAVATQVDLSDGRIAGAGIGLTAVGATNLEARDAEEFLRGKEPSDDVIAEAARRAAAAAEPKSDVRGSAEYKRDVVRVFVQRGLKTAVARAKGA